MTDLVDIFETWVESLGWVFSYGNASNNNLLVSDKVVGEIYLLLSTVNRKPIPSEFGGISSLQFSGSFMLLVKSNLDNVYHNQKGVAKEDGKYKKNIQPLIETDLMLLFDLIGCTDYEITNWEILDTVNVLDANHDGVVVTYGLTIIE